MTPFLALSRLIDQITTWVGKLSMWLILATTLISAGNAIVRKIFNVSSNGLLEIQWYLFAASFLIAAGYTLLQGEHVKVDVISSRLSKRGQIWIDIIGFAFFLTPVCFAILYYGIPFFLQGYRSGEVSANAGGLIRWPVYAMIPLGFGLLTGKYDASGTIGPAAPQTARIAKFESSRKQRWGRPEALAAAKRYSALAREHGLTPLQLALAFCYTKWQVASTLIGVTSVAQLDECLDVWGTVLSKELLARIDTIRWEIRDPAQ